MASAKRPKEMYCNGKMLNVCTCTHYATAILRCYKEYSIATRNIAFCAKGNVTKEDDMQCSVAEIKRNEEYPVPCFIAFEGIDGSGKTKLSVAIRDIFKEIGHKVTLTSEPWTSVAGQKARKAMSTLDGKLGESEIAKLFIRDRKEHVESIILPALERREIVICDRYMLSTLAYQASPEMPVKKLLGMQASLPRPDIIFYLETSATTALQRILSRTIGALGYPFTAKNIIEIGEDLKKIEKIETKERLEKLIANYKAAIEGYCEHMKKHQKQKDQLTEIVTLNTEISKTSEIYPFSPYITIDVLISVICYDIYVFLRKKQHDLYGIE